MSNKKRWLRKVSVVLAVLLIMGTTRSISVFASNNVVGVKKQEVYNNNTLMLTCVFSPSFIVNEPDTVVYSGSAGFRITIEKDGVSAYTKSTLSGGQANVSAYAIGRADYQYNGVYYGSISIRVDCDTYGNVW